MQLNTSGLWEYDEDENNSDVVKDITKELLECGNLGLGFDAGFTWPSVWKHTNNRKYSM
jgi:hypothetical protein